MIGSSPHTWGIRRGHDLRHGFQRFIPTYVGHTENNTAVAGRRAVHPHIRGAYKRALIRWKCGVGSSPHTWGIRSTRPTFVCPAGSSPHTWGIRCIFCRKLRRKRFIPTYVGHTSLRWAYLPLRPVHPHIRGAYFLLVFYLTRDYGSSPHTWGIRRMFRTGTNLFGSSPHTWGIPSGHQARAVR